MDVTEPTCLHPTAKTAVMGCGMMVAVVLFLGWLATQGPAEHRLSARPSSDRELAQETTDAEIGEFNSQSSLSTIELRRQSLTRVAERTGEITAHQAAIKQAGFQEVAAGQSRLGSALLPPGLSPVGTESATSRLATRTAETRFLDRGLSISSLPPVCLSGLPGLDPSAPQAKSEASPASSTELAGAQVSVASSSTSAATTGSPAPQLYHPRSDLASTPAYMNPHRRATQAGRVLADAHWDGSDDPHAKVFSETLYPSARECAQCHAQIYEEWSTSSHAYAGISPMFHRFEQKISDLSQGTIGYFCIRCHAPVAISMNLRRDQAIWDGPEVFREGVTCVACHRVNENYGKVNGERRMEPGSIYAPVFGAGDGNGIEQALRDRDFYKVKDSPPGTGQALHRRGIQFEQLSKSDFCVSCHQVSVYPGIKLEVVWDQYVASPAYREGITCQDCHMGRVPGVPDGYSIGPAAVLDNKVIDPNRKHSNHNFFGPGYSIAHPGIFPQHKDQNRWSFNEWLEFDWRAGWGTDAFEQSLKRGEFYCDFPPAWRLADDRYDAREIIDENLGKLNYKRDLRRQVLENGSHIDGPYFRDGCVENDERVLPRGEDAALHYVVTNLNSGHNLPTGSLGAQPQVWLNVVLIDPRGRRVWESGYLDSHGDLADLHSQDVLTGIIPHDDQLFNLQSKFLITNIKGTEREIPLPINIDVDQLPFLRPSGLPVTVLNHPPLIRMEAHSIPPLGSRVARYRIPAANLSLPGRYRLSVRLRSRTEPIYFMRFVQSTPEMIRAMNEGIGNAHEYTVTFTVR